MKNYVLTALDKGKNVRVKAIYGKDLVSEARKIHNTSPVASAALGRTLLMASMIGTTFKNEKDKGTFIIKGDGNLKGLIVTTSHGGNVKGYVYNPNALTGINEKGKLDVKGAIGNGTLTVIKDLGLKEPYSGTINFISGEIAEDFAYYYVMSEQTPSSVGLGVLVDTNGDILEAGGFFISVLPDANDEIIKKIEKNVCSIASITDILKEGKKCEDILNIILDGIDYDVIDTVYPNYVCDCSKDRVANALRTISRDELKNIIDEDKKADISCEFCRNIYHFTLEELNDILNGNDKGDNE